MKKEQVIIKLPTDTSDTEGIISRQLTEVATVQCTVLPITQELALKRYGIEDPVKYQCFTKQRHSEIQKGNWLMVRGDDLQIVYVGDFGKVLDILVSKQVNKQ